MHIDLDKDRLSLWAKRLNAFLGEAPHPAKPLSHSAAIAAIAAMLGEPNANTLVARLKQEADAAARNSHRSTVRICWVWCDPIQAFETSARLTEDEAARLTAVLEKLDWEFEDLQVVADPSVEAAHPDLESLIAEELDEALWCAQWLHRTNSDDPISPLRALLSEERRNALPEQED